MALIVDKALLGHLHSGESFILADEVERADRPVYLVLSHTILGTVRVSEIGPRPVKQAELPDSTEVLRVRIITLCFEWEDQRLDPAVGTLVD